MRFAIICLTVGLLSCLGCGDSVDGPAKFELTGAVKVGTEPAPGGTISLEPDTSKGGSGPGAVGDIQEDGTYSVHVTPGPHIVRITPPEIPSGSDDVPVAFSNYETTVSIPEQDSTQDFDVSKSGD